MIVYLLKYDRDESNFGFNFLHNYFNYYYSLVRIFLEKVALKYFITL